MCQLCEQAASLAAEGGVANSDKYHMILNEFAINIRARFKTEEQQLKAGGLGLRNSHDANYLACESELTELLIAASNGVYDTARLSRFVQGWCV